jgi:hypothetical protein
MKKFITVLLGLSMALGTATLSLAGEQDQGTGQSQGTQGPRAGKGKRHGKRGGKGKGGKRNRNGGAGQTPTTPQPK